MRVEVQFSLVGMPTVNEAAGGADYTKDQFFLLGCQPQRR